MTADISLSENGELSESDREIVDMLVERLRTAVGVDKSGLPPLSVERTEGSVILRPDEPMFVDELNRRFKVRAVSRNDNGVRTTTKVDVQDGDQESAETRS